MSRQYDLEPSDPDFPYLAVDRTNLSQEVAAYDGKKSCWIPDVQDGYLAAEIQQTRDSDVTVRTQRGDVGEVTLFQARDLKCDVSVFTDEERYDVTC